jgi:hypothetical protein
MVFRLAGGAVVYTDAEALATINQYAFSTEWLRPSRGYGGTFEPAQVPLYAYRTYDCVLPSPGPDLTDLDLLVTAGLNARIDVAAVVRLRSFADRAAPHLQSAHEIQPDFVAFNRDELADNPPEGTAGWHLNAAWLHGVATPDLRTARVYKTLHHKRPHLMPLLDRKTGPWISAAAQRARCTLWQLIYDELHSHAEEFGQLEADFAGAATGPTDVQLSRLRLYDILLWMHATNQPAAI